MNFADWMIVTCITGVIFCYFKLFERVIAIYRLASLLKRIKRLKDEEK